MEKEYKVDTPRAIIITAIIYALISLFLNTNNTRSELNLVILWVFIIVQLVFYIWIFIASSSSLNKSGAPYIIGNLLPIILFITGRINDWELIAIPLMIIVTLWFSTAKNNSTNALIEKNNYNNSSESSLKSEFDFSNGLKYLSRQVETKSKNELLNINKNEKQFRAYIKKEYKKSFKKPQGQSDIYYYRVHFLANPFTELAIRSGLKLEIFEDKIIPRYFIKDQIRLRLFIEAYNELIKKNDSDKENQLNRIAELINKFVK